MIDINLGFELTLCTHENFLFALRGHTGYSTPRFANFFSGKYSTLRPNVIKDIVGSEKI